MNDEIYNRYIKHFDVNLLDCEFLGKGHNGVVYMLPDNHIIKICFEAKSCEKEYKILERIGNNPYFPQVYGMSGNYMIRDFVDGITLKDHIKKYGLDRDLSKKIIKILDQFKKLNFSKLDVRCKDIMILADGSLKIIDPKKFYTKKRDFPKHLSKGLYNLGVLDSFMLAVKENRPDLYKKWNKKIKEYIREKQEEKQTKD